MTGSTILTAVNSLNISENKYLLTDTRELIDPVEIALKKIGSHPSVFNIKDNIKASHFSFSEIVLSDIETELNNLKSDKASTYKNIPAKQYTFLVISYVTDTKNSL